MDEPVSLKLGRNEALILFEMLADFYNQPALTVRDAAERLALVRLHGSLESALVEPFQPDYRELIDVARKQLIDQAG